MENYQKMSIRINLDLKKSKNIEQIGNLKIFGETKKYWEEQEVCATLV